MHPEPDLLSAFRRAVDAKIRRDLSRERAEAEARVASVRALLIPVVAAERAAGRVGAVWLFGSMAWSADSVEWQAPTERSDVDLLVDGCAEPLALSGVVGDASGLEVHVVPLARAPRSLVERATVRGVRL